MTYLKISINIIAICITVVVQSLAHVKNEENNPHKKEPGLVESICITA